MTTRRTRSLWPARVAVAKDLILFTVGTGLIAWQGFVVPPPDFNLSKMIFGGVLAGVPGMLYAFQMVLRPAAPTDGLSSEDLAPQSSQPS